MRAPREILVVREWDRFGEKLSAAGFAVANFPTIRSDAVADLSELEDLLAEIDSFDGIFLTSAKATGVLLGKFREKCVKFRGKFYVLGKKSSDLLTAEGYHPIFFREAAAAAEMLTLIPEDELKGKKFLFPRGNLSLRVIPQRLAGISQLKETVVYKTTATETDEKQSDKIKGKLESGGYTAVCFFSPSAVESFLERMGGCVAAPEGTTIAAIGRTTAAAAAERGLRVDFVSARPAAEDFAGELIEFLNSQGKKF